MNNEKQIREIKMRSYQTGKKPSIFVDEKLWLLVDEFQFNIVITDNNPQPTCRLIIDFPIESTQFVGENDIVLTLPKPVRKKSCRSKEKKQHRTGSSDG